MSKSRNQSAAPTRGRRARWALPAVVALAAAAAFAYSISGGLSQLFAAVAGFEEWGAEARRNTAPPAAASRSSASTETRQRAANDAVTSDIDTEHGSSRASALEPPDPVPPLAEPAPPPAVYSTEDVAAFRGRLEAALEADPEALESVRELFNEPDPAALAENMRVLRDTFGID